MIILRIVINDFGPFKGEHEFVFDERGLTLVLGKNDDEPRMNSNGSGKSALFDALDWCLFGEVPRDDHVTSIINHGAEACSVRSFLENELEQSLEIYRARKKKGMDLEFRRDGVEFTALDTKETQHLIEEELGMDRTVFHATVLYAQTDQFDFADASDSERLDILSKVLQLESLDSYKIRLAELIHEKETERNQIMWAIANLDGQIQSHVDQLATIDDSIRTWDNERAAKLHDATRMLNDYLRNIEEQEKIAIHEPQVTANYQLALTQYRDIQTTLDTSGKYYSPAPTLGGQIEAARDKESLFKAELYNIEQMGKRLKIELEQFQTMGEGVCGYCGQTITAGHLDKEIARLESELETMRQQYANTKIKVDAAAAEYVRIKQEGDRQIALHHEADKENMRVMNEAKLQMKAVEDANAYLARAKPYVEDLRKTMATTQAADNPWRVRAGTLNEELGTLRLRRVSLETQLRDIKDQFKYLEFWKTAFGPKGLRNYILDTRLQEMTDAANEWVQLLTGGTIWIRFETQTMGRTTNKLSNKLNIRVFRYNPDGSIIEQNYKSWSGGEKKRISWAIDFGLSRLVAARAKKSYDLLILDEVFKYVDAAGGEAVMDMLNSLRHEKSSIFVVEHDANFQNHFENRVTIHKTNGVSRIIEERSIHAVQAESESPERRSNL